jgi:hypothetical protein
MEFDAGDASAESTIVKVIVGVPFTVVVAELALPELVVPGLPPPPPQAAITTAVAKPIKIFIKFILNSLKGSFKSRLSDQDHVQRQLLA